MGRIDQQIKIRGVRIELGEIEVVLREHPGVRDAVVVVQEGEADDKRLVAYVVPGAKQIPTAVQLQQFLGTKLPKILVPTSVIFLAKFPKTPNGKLDRRALPKTDHKASQTLERHRQRSRTADSGNLVRSARVESVGVKDRFFDIGGHSLLMIEVHDQLREKTGHRVALLDLFHYPTVRSLARYLGKRPLKMMTETSGLNRGQLRQRLAAHQSTIRKAVSSKRAS